MPRSVNLYLLFLLLVFLQTNLSGFSQNTSLPIDEWVKKLQEKDDINNKKLQEIRGIIDRKDSAGVYTCIEQLKKPERQIYILKQGFLF